MLQFYNTDKGSVLGTLIESVGHEISVTDGNIDVIDNMLGLSTTNGDDLDIRWGAMLNMPRRKNESDEIYRNRLKIAFNADGGGTIASIQRAVSTVIGIEGNQPEIERRITVYDSWEYNGEFLSQITVGPGHGVCIVDLDNQLFDKYGGDVTDAIRDAIINAKSLGVTIHVFIINYRILTYEQMGALTYQDLSGVRYNQLGGVDSSGNLFRHVEVV